MRARRGRNMDAFRRDSMATPQTTAAPGFPSICRQWRQFRKLSQLDLALAANVSQRHLSWLETGRSQPSREMVVRLSDALDVPLRERNALFQSAGFAPVYSESRLEDPVMAPVLDALNHVLEHHEPLPAVVVDRCWNMRKKNRAADLLFSLGGEPAGMLQRIGDQGEFNLALITVHPLGLRQYIENWEQAAPAFIRRLQREALASGEPELQAAFPADYRSGRPAGAPAITSRSPCCRCSRWNSISGVLNSACFRLYPPSARPRTSPRTSCGSRLSTPPTRQPRSSSGARRGPRQHHSAGGSGSLPVKGQHLAYIRNAGGQHQQPVHPQRHPAAFGQAVIEGRQQARVQRAFGQAAFPPPGIVALEAPPLFLRILQFEIAVGQFHAVDVQLETVPHHHPGAIFNPRQGRLGGGVVPDKAHAEPAPAAAR